MYLFINHWLPFRIPNSDSRVRVRVRVPGRTLLVTRHQQLTRLSLAPSISANPSQPPSPPTTSPMIRPTPSSTRLPLPRFPNPFILRSLNFCSAPSLATSSRPFSSASRPLRSASLCPQAQRPIPRRSFHSSRWSLAETVKVPQMAESISEGTLKQWLKKPGDFVRADEEVATIETDKIDVSVNAPRAGTIIDALAAEEDTVTVGQDLFTLEPGEAPEGGTEAPAASESVPQEDLKAGAKSEGEAKKNAASAEDRKPAPAAEQPKQPPVDRKRWDDVAVEKKEQQPSRAEPQLTESKQPLGRTDFGDKPADSAADARRPTPFERTERKVKMSRMRSRISERLKQSQNTAAALTTFNEIDMSSLMEMRGRYKEGILKERGVKLGFMSAFAKAACLALREIPGANASIEGPGVGEQIVYRDYVDLSVAVATPKGLVTPVVRNAESLGMVEIEEEIARLGAKARDNKLSLEDMAGGTFTISNGGVFGSLYGTPIINLPQSAVLGMHSIKDTPVVRDGQIVIRPIMIVALTYDHRILDGREAVTFLVKIKQYIEDPRKMLLA